MTKVTKVNDAPPPAVDRGHVGGGWEDVSSDEMRVPIIRPLHQMSPQCRPTEQGGLEGAMPGMIYNTATNALHDGAKGIEFIPCFRCVNYVEYVPRSQGGGFIGVRDPDDPLVTDLRRAQGRFGKLKTTDGSELVETMYLYGLILGEDGAVAEAVVPFASSQISQYQTFITRYRLVLRTKGGKTVQPNLWDHRIRLTTVFRKNDKGSWYGWSIAPANGSITASFVPEGDPLLAIASRFHRSLAEGRAKADHAAADKAEQLDDAVPY
jgi:hypothetical protein